MKSAGDQCDIYGLILDARLEQAKRRQRSRAGLGSPGQAPGVKTELPALPSQRRLRDGDRGAVGRGRAPQDPPTHGVVKLPSTFLPAVSSLSCE